MKTAIYFFGLIALFLVYVEGTAQWQYERNFKSFKKIELKGPMANNAVAVYWKSIYGQPSSEFYDDSTIVGLGWFWNDSTSVFSRYIKNVWKLNIQTGKSEILFDSSKALFKSLYHGVKTINRISVFKDLILCEDFMDNNYVRGYFIVGKNNFMKYFYVDTMLLRTKATKILDCRFSGDGTLLATARYPDGIGVIISNDTGSTWKNPGVLIDGFKESNQYFPLVIGGAEGTFGVHGVDSSNRSCLAKTLDLGNSWQQSLLSYNQSIPKIYGYFPSKISGENDTIFGLFIPIYNGMDTVYFEFIRSVNSGKDWQTLIKLPFIGATDKDTSHFWCFPFVQSVNNLYIGSTDGVLYSKNGGLTWTKYFMPTISNIVDFIMIDNQRGVLTRGNLKFGESGLIIGRARNSDFYLFELGECSGDGFEYKNLFNPFNIAYKGNAKTIGDYVRLTESRPDQSGSMWYDKPLAFNRSFDAKFGFKMTEGVNGEDDKTSPGADGVTLVIAKQIPTAAGENGGGIGYNGINSALAIEFDSFINKNRSDPDYDHAGVFASNTSIENNHSSAFCLGTAQIRGQLRADISKHEVTVKYLKDKKILEVYLDDETGNPLLRIKDFDIEKYLGGPIGYIGITSSTGSSMQNHFISDFSVCINGESTVGVEEPSQPTISGEKAFPNPARETINIELPAGISPGNVEARIFNQIGNEVSRQMVQIGINASAVPINVSGLAAGVYFIRITQTGKKAISAKVIIER